MPSDTSVRWEDVRRRKTKLEGTRRKRSGCWWLVIACFAVLACGLAYVAIEAVQQAPAPTAEPTASPTMAPTATPKPTETQARTPTSTAKPTPADTATPTVDSLETEYAQEIAALSNAWSSAFAAISTLATDAGDNPVLMFDEDWQGSMARVLVIIQVTDDRIRGLDPPSKFTDVHKDLLSAAGHFDVMIELMILGIDNMDAEALTGATEHMNAGTEFVQKATAKLQALTGE